MSGTPVRSSFWMRAVQALALAVAVCFSLGATRLQRALPRPEPPADVHLRLRAIAGRMQPCGLPDVRAGTGRVESGHRRRHERQADFGTRSPPSTAPPCWPRPPRMDSTWWPGLRPFAVFGAALLGTILLVRRWAGLSAAKALAAGPEAVATIRPIWRAGKRFAGRPAATEVIEP